MDYICLMHLKKKKLKKIKMCIKKLLENIKIKYCPLCDVGAASIKIGYQSSGTCLDYVYDKLNVTYSFAWEVYTNEVELPELKKLRTRSLDFNLRNRKFLNAVKSIRPSNFLEVSDKEKMITYKNKNRFFIGRTYSPYETKTCLTLFNPIDKLSYSYIRNNWTNAIKDLFENLIGK